MQFFRWGPADITFGEQMKLRIPGRELGDNELFQFVEESIMKEEDYHTIIERGLTAWQFPYIASIQTPPIPQMSIFSSVSERVSWSLEKIWPIIFNIGQCREFPHFIIIPVSRHLICFLWHGEWKISFMICMMSLSW